MSSVDNRVVEMRFNNKQFESGVQTSLSSLQKLKEGLNLDGASRSLSNLMSVGKSFSLDGISAGVENISDRFSMLGVIGATVISNLTTSAMNLASKISNAVMSPIIEGGKNRALNIEQAKFQLEGLEVAWEKIEDDISYGVKGTAYGLDAAAKVASQLVASNIQVGDSMKTALRGVSGVAAMTSSSYEEIGHIFTTVAGQGRLMSIQLQQLSTRGLNAAATLADYLHVTEAELREMVTKGQIDFATFAAAMDNAYGEHATDANKTFTGALSNMKAALSRIGAKVATPAFDNLRDILNALIPVIDGANVALTPLVNTMTKGIEIASKFTVDKLGRFDATKLEALNTIISSSVKSLLNIGKGLLGIIKPIKRASEEVFPPVTIENIANFTKKLETLTSKFKIGDKTADKLKSTSKGLFSVLNLVKEMFSSIGRILSPLTKYFGKLGGSILDTTGDLGDYISKIDETVKKNDTFYKALQKIIEYVKTAYDNTKTAVMGFVDEFKKQIEKMKNRFIEIKSVITNLIGEFTKEFKKFSGIKIYMPSLEDFHKFLGKIKERLSKLSDVFKKAKDSVSEFLDSFKDDKTKDAEERTSLIEKLTTVFQTMGRIIGKIVGTIKTALTTFANAFIETFSKDDLDEIYGMVNSGLITGIFLGIKKFIDGLSSVVSSGGIVDNLNGVLVDVRGNLKAYQNEIKSKQLLTIAEAIAILAASLAVLSMLNQEKLTNALGATMGLFIQLFGSMLVLEKFSVGGSLNKITAFSLNMITVSVALTILSSAMKKIAKLDWDGVAKGLITVASLSAVLIVTAKLIGGSASGLLKGAIGLTMFASAVKILGTVVKSLSSLDTAELTKGLIGVTVLLAGLAAFLKLANFDKMGVLKGIGLVALATSIKILDSAVKSFSSLDFAPMLQGLLGVTVILGALAAFTKLTGNAKHVISTAIGLTIISASMLIFSKAISSMGKIPLEELGKGLLAMAVSLAAVTLAVRFMPATMPLIGIGLIAVAAAMNILSVALRSLSEMSWEGLTKGVLTLTLSLAATATAMHFMTTALPGAAALLIISGALAILVPVLKTFGNMSLLEIGKGLLVLAGAFAVFGIASALLSPIIPVMLGLAGSVALLGVGLLGLGAGMVAVAVGIAALAASSIGISAFIGAIGQAIVALIGSLTLIVISLLKTLDTILPMLVDVGLHIILSIVQGIAENIGPIVECGMLIILNLLKGLASHLDEITIVTISILVKLINGIAVMLPDIIQSGVNLMGISKNPCTTHPKSSIIEI